MLACIVRFTAVDPGPTGALLLFTAGFLLLISFAAGFAASRYWIHRELADSTQVLNRSAHAYETEQVVLFREWADAYAHLARRIATIPERKEVLQRGRR
jgi:hypothetical protein